MRGWLRDAAAARCPTDADEWPTFADAVTVARLLARHGTTPIIAAATLHRAWFAQQRALSVTVPGASDQFVNAVLEVIHARV